MYDVLTSQWHTLTNSSTPRYLASLTISDHVLYFIGGFEQEVNGTIPRPQAFKQEKGLGCIDMASKNGEFI